MQRVAQEHQGREKLHGKHSDKISGLTVTLGTRVYHRVRHGNEVSTASGPDPNDTEENGLLLM